MAKIRRGNVILRIDDADIDYYVNTGYNLIDEKSGTVIRTAIPSNIGELQTHYIESNKKIAELEDTVAKLTAEIAQAKKVKVEPKVTPKKAKEE